ncbi:MAG: hypothetical protein IH984_05925 [Planctomycetes bacterium]|nr:hypothetical protein [Planctomycetota bacterium]
MRTIIMCIVLSLCTAASADREGLNRTRVFASSSGYIYARSEPRDNHGTVGVTKIYRVAAGDQLICEFPWYTRQLYLYQLGSDVAIVRKGLWPRGRKANPDSLSLEFYLNDKLLKRYSTLDIAVGPDNVFASVSHHRVISRIHGFRRRVPLPPESQAPDDADKTKEPRERRTPRDVFFEVQTTDGRLLIFDLWAGEQVTEQQAGALVEPRVRASRLPPPQEKQLSNYDSGLAFLERTPQTISEFVRRIFQDSNGNLWFGTNGDGVVRYDGDSLEYFSINEGFGGRAVRGIVEDKDGSVWFGTSGGVTKYDGQSFTNFTENDGLINNDVWSIVIDSKGIIWIGTLQGVSRFDGEVFTPFDIPEVEPDPTRGVSSARIVHCIMEDSKGRMWFATNGGAYIYDGKTLSHISEKDGLCNNSVNCILEGKDGNIWFATHHNGVCRYDGKSFTHITAKDGVIGTEAWDLYQDSKGNIWFPIENSGVYRYDGKSFTNFQKEQGLTTNAIQCTFEDNQGRLWLGGWMGLFRYDGKSIFSVGKNGPWTN